MKTEAVEAKQKLLQQVDGDHLTFAYWGSFDVKNLSRQGMNLSSSSRDMHGKQDELSLPGPDIAVRLLHELFGIILDTALSEEICRSVKRTIPALSRVNAFIATALTTLREHGSDSVGGHRQKLYLDTFTNFLPLAYNQLTVVVGQYVKGWCPIDVFLDALSLDSSCEPKDPLVERKNRK